MALFCCFLQKECVEVVILVKGFLVHDILISLESRDGKHSNFCIYYVISCWEINSNIYTSILYSVSLFMQFGYSSSILFIPFQSEDIGQITTYILLILLLGIIIFPSKKYTKYKISEKQRNVFILHHRSKVLILHTFLPLFHLVTNPTIK